MVHRNGNTLQHRGHNCSLPQGTVLFAQWKKDALEECGRFVHTLLQCDVVVIVELLVGIDIGPNGVEQHKVVETLGHFGIEVGRKDARRGVHGLRSPEVRSS